MLAEPPIALCEVQAYTYAAKRSAAMLAGEFGENDLALKLNLEADRLQQRFEEEFWCEEIGMYALALDGKKQQCKVRSSNAAQTLFCKIASPERAAIMCSQLMSSQLFSGWGVRTIGSSELRYNPMSYHNGSVWPHDNALIGLGSFSTVSRTPSPPSSTVFTKPACTSTCIACPNFSAASTSAPNPSAPLYPVACAPAAPDACPPPFLPATPCSGRSKAAKAQASFPNPILPANIEEVRIDNLGIPGADCDVIIHRYSAGVSVDILRKKGDIEVLKIPVASVNYYF